MEISLILSLIFRIFLGIILVFGGVMKVLDLKGFHLITIQFGILPRKLNKLFSYTLPFIEIIVGLALLFNFNVFYFAIITLLMMMSYSIGTFYGLYQKKKINNCGCYGIKFKVPLTWRKFLENLIYLLMALYLIII